MGPATFRTRTLLIQSILLIRWFTGLFLLAAAEIVRPDIRSCHHDYGLLDRPSCETVIENLPRGSLPSIFSTRQGTMGNMFILPRVDVDSAERPRCVVTIDLDGHSNRNVFVLVPWNKIREMAKTILDLCVSSNGFGWGGTVTFGLQRTFDALVHPVRYDLDRGPVAVPAEVIQPDGSRGIVAIPPGAFGQDYGKPLEIAEQTLPVDSVCINCATTDYTSYEPLISYVEVLTVPQMCRST